MPLTLVSVARTSSCFLWLQPSIQRNHILLFLLFQLSLERLAERHAQQLRSLFKFTQGAAHLWDVHEINLAKKERHLQEQLEECRRHHDNVNQVSNSEIFLYTLPLNGSHIVSTKLLKVNLQFNFKRQTMLNPINILCRIWYNSPES